MRDVLAPGARVRIVKDAGWDGPWPTEPLGTIDPVGPPEEVVHARAIPGELKYWVRFDESQIDAEGQGPYYLAQIWGRYVRPVSASG